MSTNKTGDKEVRLVVCIFVSIPVTIFLFYSFAKCHHWGRLDKAYKGSLYYFLQLHVNLQLSP